MNNKNPFLILAAALSFGIAVFQAVISFVPEWCAAFGLGDELVSNPLLLLAAGLGMTLVFSACGFYALSGAGIIRRLPLLRTGLLLIGAVYLLRGLPIVLQILVVLNVLPSQGPVPAIYLMVFLVAFLTGLAFLIGLVVGWKQMKQLPGAAVIV